MSNTQRRWLTLFAATAAILMVFIIRTIMARAGTPPRLFDIFDTAISLASLGVVVVGWRTLSRTNSLRSVLGRDCSWPFCCLWPHCIVLIHFLRS